MRRVWDYMRCLTPWEKTQIAINQQLADDHHTEYLKHKAKVDQIRRRAAKEARAKGYKMRGIAT